MLQPLCPRCRKRHRPELPHWWGAYASRLSRLTLANQGVICWICGGLATTADHVTPRSKGGDDSQENLRPACSGCNASRGNEDNPFQADTPPTPTGAGLSLRWR